MNNNNGIKLYKITPTGEELVLTLNIEHFIFINKVFNLVEYYINLNKLNIFDYYININGSIYTYFINPDTQEEGWVVE